MKPLYLRIVLVLGALAMLAACLEYESKIKVNADGSGTAVLHYSVPQGFLAQSDLGDQIPLTEADVDASYRMRAGVTQYRSQVRQVQDNREVTIHVEFDNVTSLSERGSEYSYGIEGPYRVFRIKINRKASGMGDTRARSNPIHDMAMRNIVDQHSIRYEVQLPQPIVRSNAQSVDWNTAKWEIPLSTFLNPEKEYIILEARSRASRWEQIKWRVSNLFG